MPAKCKNSMKCTTEKTATIINNCKFKEITITCSINSLCELATTLHKTQKCLACVGLFSLLCLDFLWSYFCFQIQTFRFIWAVLMSGRWHKKLSLLIKLSNSIFIKFDVKPFWCWVCIQNKESYKVSFYFKLFICLPDVKRPKLFYGFTSLKPHQRSTVNRLLS